MSGPIQMLRAAARRVFEPDVDPDKHERILRTMEVKAAEVDEVSERLERQTFLRRRGGATGNVDADLSTGAFDEGRRRAGWEAR